MGKAIRKEKYDIGFMRYEEIQKLYEERKTNEGLISVGNEGYTFDTTKYYEWRVIKKFLNPDYFLFETPDRDLKVTKDDILCCGLDNKAYALNKEVFEMTFEIIEEEIK